MTVRSPLLVTRARTERPLKYTYILSLPLITIYSVGNAVIKYQEGFVFDPRVGGEIITYYFWPQDHLLTSFSVPKAAY